MARRPLRHPAVAMRCAIAGIGIAVPALRASRGSGTVIADPCRLAGGDPHLPTMPHRSRSDVQVRPARRADVPAIVHLLADDPLGATREQPGEPLARAYWDAFDAIAAQAGNEVLVAEVAGEVAGCLQLTVIPGLSRTGMTRAQLEGVRVSARHRGHGIGESLVRAAVERARGHGCRLVQLTTDHTRTDARRFYERLGFEASHVGMKLALG